jgi:hypothetical protein
MLSCMSFLRKSTDVARGHYRRALPNLTDTVGQQGLAK